jgi:hypothetical protein
MKNWYVLARWESQSYINLAFTPEQFFDHAQFHHGPKTIEYVQIEMIKNLLPFVKTRVLANYEQQVGSFRQLLENI